MDTSKALALMRKYQEGTLTESEKEALDSWYIKYANSREAFMESEELEERLEAVWKSMPLDEEAHVPGEIRSIGRQWWWSAAASVLLILGAAYWFMERPGTVVSKENVLASEQIKPGENKAFLTLSSGKKIDLSVTDKGELAQDGGMSVVKTGYGEVSYLESAESKSSSGAVTYNEIHTPRAGQYSVILPDGSKIWLNAESSVRFPTLFADDSRVVEVHGEVYLEVAKRSKNGRRVPFKVRCGNQVIEVLGTRFNVNSYADESAIRTTLVEGSIKVEVDDVRKKEVVLRPGQQLQYIPHNSSGSTNYMKVSQVNTENVVAWKDGYFHFDNVSLREVMRQISRWYNVQVVYEGEFGRHEFVGKMERSVNLNEVLSILEVGGVSFRIQGQKVIVSE